jgi:hypothetical protein
MQPTLDPVEARWTPREPWDGGTCLSDELGLPGPVRALAWVIIADTAINEDLHLLYDCPAPHAITHTFRDAHRWLTLTTGTIVATRGDITDATQTQTATYRPTPDTPGDTIIDIPMPNQGQTNP